MQLTEALTGTTIAGAERTVGQCHVIIHRSRAGYHLSRSASDGSGNLHQSTWTFLNLYELLTFARTQGFSEVDADAPDWRKVF